MLQAKPVEISDWSGGVTEDAVTELNNYTKADNLFLTVNQNWLSRDGSQIFDSAAEAVAAGNPRVGTLINFNKDDSLLAHSLTHLYLYSTGAWTEIFGPTGNVAFIGATTAGRLSVAEWKKHLFVASTEQILPVKILKDEGLYPTDTAFTVTIASPGVFTTSTTTGFYIGMRIVLATSGALPTGLTAGPTYYILTIPSATTFTVSASSGGAAVNTSGSQSGSHTFSTRIWVAYSAGLPAPATPLNYSVATSQTFTVTLASPGVFTVASTAAFYYNMPIIFTTSGALPTGLTAGVTYYIKAIVSSTTFTVSDTQRGANVNTSVSQSGVHTASYGVLTSAITMANSLRTNLTNHFTNSGGVFHLSSDTVSSGILSAAASTDLATLITLTNQLISAYSTHFLDAYSKGVYHQKFQTTGFCQAPITEHQLLSTAVATDLKTCVALLNDLCTRYNTHSGSFSGHGGIDVSLNPELSTMIPELTSGANAIFDPTILYSYANTIKNRFNEHLIDGAAAGTVTISLASPGVVTISTTRGFVVGKPVVFTTTGSLPAEIISGTTYYVRTILSATTFTVSATIGGTAINTSSASTATTTMTNYLPASAAHSPAADYTYLNTSIDMTTDVELEIFIGAANAATGIMYEYMQHSGLISGVGFHVVAPVFSVAGLPQNWVDASRSGIYPDYYGGARVGNYSYAISLLNTLKTQFNLHIYDYSAHYTNNPTSYTLPNGTVVNTILQGITAPNISLASYNYAILYKHSYTIGATSYETRSTPTYFTAKNVIDISLQPLSIKNIPALANSTLFNYDTSNLTIEIYRTTATGSSYYLSGFVSNGVTTYSDTMQDTDLIKQAQLYTNGGIEPHDQPPAVKFVHTVNNFAYWLNSVANPNRVLQSFGNILDGAYGSNYVDLPNDIVGASSIQGILVVFTQNGHYRVEGSFDEKGNGVMSHTAISETIGLAASLSPVQTDLGIVFAGTDGFYVCNGYKSQKINKLWPLAYAAYISTAAKRALIQGTYDRTNRRVWWSVGDGASEANAVVVLDLNFPLTENAIFTTLSGGSNFAPTTAVNWKGNMLRGDTRGYVFKHDPSYTNDPKVNTGTASTTWTTAWITYNYKSPAYTFNVTNTRKWIPQIVANFQYHSNISLQFISNNDQGRVISNLAPIRYRGTNGVIQEKRKFPAGSMRCSTKQIQFTNAKVVMHSSDALGLAALNHAAKTLTLAAGSWATDLTDQKITFVNDGYVTEWTIASVSGAIMTITDAGGTLPATAATIKWEVKGYPKDEIIELHSYALMIALLGDSQQSSKGESGANT